MLHKLICRKKITKEEKYKKYIDKHVEIVVRKEEPSLRIQAFLDKKYIGEIKSVINVEEKEILIGDFIIEKEWYRNKGFGTELMNKFMEVANGYNPKKYMEIYQRQISLIKTDLFIFIKNMDLVLFSKKIV